MDSLRQHMEWIEKYLDGKLSARELEVFERMQEEDASLKKLVTDMELLVSGSSDLVSVAAQERYPPFLPGQFPDGRRGI